MRLQFRVSAGDAGLADPVPSHEARELVERIRQQMTAAGLPAWIGSDNAFVSPGEPDWDVLSPQERSVGGFTYPELRVDGPADIAVCVFKRSVFFDADTDFDDEQGAAGQVVTALRALEGLVPVPDEVTAAVNQWARQLQVAADGTVLRSVLSWSQQNEQAIELFDRVLVPERRRPTAEAFARDHFDVLADLVRDAPPFRVAVAADPSGASFGMRVPAALEQAPFGSQLQDAIRELLSSALQQPWQATGLPTGLVAEFDGRHLDSRLVFDNLVDSGAFDPDSRQASHRTAPHAWDSITVAAARPRPPFSARLGIPGSRDPPGRRPRRAGQPCNDRTPCRTRI